MLVAQVSLRSMWGVREGHLPLLQNCCRGWFPSSTPLAGKLLEGEATSYFFNLFYHQRIGHERITLWCLVTMYSGEENLGMTMSGGQNVPFAPGVLGALKCYPEN